MMEGLSFRPKLVSHLHILATILKNLKDDSGPPGLDQLDHVGVRKSADPHAVDLCEAAVKTVERMDDTAT